MAQLGHRGGRDEYWQIASYAHEVGVDGSVGDAVEDTGTEVVLLEGLGVVVEGWGDGRLIINKGVLEERLLG